MAYRTIINAAVLLFSSVVVAYMGLMHLKPWLVQGVLGWGSRRLSADSIGSSPNAPLFSQVPLAPDVLYLGLGMLVSAALMLLAFYFNLRRLGQA